MLHNANVTHNTHTYPLYVFTDSLVQLSGIESDQGANEWQRVVVDVRKTVSELMALKSQCNDLLQETTQKNGREGREEGSWLSDRGLMCVGEVEPLVKELVQLEQLQSYFMWMRRLQQLW